MTFLINTLMRTKPARSMILPRMVVTGPGVLEQIPAIIAELDIPERGLLVCDTNTLEIAGNQVIDYLEAGGHPMQRVEIKGANIEELERVESFSEDIAFLVGLATTLTRSTMIGFFDVLPVYILMGIAIFMMVYEAFFDKK